MTDPNNIPQEAQQLKEDLNTPQEAQKEAQKKVQSEQSTPEVADTDFDKEYKIAQQNETGSGVQSSDPNPVNRKGASAGANGSSAGKVDNVNSPGDSDPDDYVDMAKDVIKNVDANKA